MCSHSRQLRRVPMTVEFKRYIRREFPSLRVPAGARLTTCHCKRKRPMILLITYPPKLTLVGKKRERHWDGAAFCPTCKFGNACSFPDREV